jgi:hypothetical protein
MLAGYMRGTATGPKPGGCDTGRGVEHNVVPAGDLQWVDTVEHPDC